MNIEEIKKKVTDYKSELIRSRECCDVVDLSDETLHLLSIIEQAEKVFTKMSTGDFSAPMELSQVEAYQAYAKSMVEYLGKGE